MAKWRGISFQLVLNYQNRFSGGWRGDNDNIRKHAFVQGRFSSGHKTRFQHAACTIARTNLQSIYALIATLITQYDVITFLYDTRLPPAGGCVPTGKV